MCVSVWGICVSREWVMNSCQQAGTASSSVTGAWCMFAHVIKDVCFSTCCWGTGAERWVRKGVIVQKPVGWMQTRERQLTVWSWVTCGQVLAGWLLCALSWKTICWDDSIKGNRPARKPLVITQPAFQAESAKRGQEGEKGNGRKKKTGERQEFWVVQKRVCFGCQTESWESDLFFYFYAANLK